MSRSANTSTITLPRCPPPKSKNTKKLPSSSGDASVAGSAQMATNLLLDQMAVPNAMNPVATLVIAAPTPAAAFAHQVDGLPPRMPVPQAGCPVELAERRHVNGDKHRVFNVWRLVPPVLAC